MPIVEGGAECHILAARIKISPKHQKHPKTNAKYRIHHRNHDKRSKTGTCT